MTRDPATELAALAADGLLRTLRPLDSPAGPRVTRDGRELHNFASNDYLGLATDPELAAAFIDGIRRYGAGSAASRLVCGTLPPHAALEETLAGAKSAEAATGDTFGTGIRSRATTSNPIRNSTSRMSDRSGRGLR